MIRSKIPFWFITICALALSSMAGCSPSNDSPSDSEEAEEVADDDVVCGDGAIGAGETCDDDGTDAGDGCSATCQVETGWTCTGEPSACTETCGDGMRVGAEACDDGDTDPGDGCDASCQVEAGWSCDGSEPDVCTEDPLTANLNGTQVAIPEPLDPNVTESTPSAGFSGTPDVWVPLDAMVVTAVADAETAADLMTGEPAALPDYFATDPPADPGI